MINRLISLSIAFILLIALCSCGADETEVTGESMTGSEKSQALSGDETTSETSPETEAETASQSKSSKSSKASASSGKSSSSSSSSSSSATTSATTPAVSLMISVDKMPAGTDIPFTVGINTNIHMGSDEYFHAVIVRSYAELKEIYTNDYNPNEYKYIEKYNDSFFKEGALVLMFNTQSSGSNRINIDSLIKEENELCIDMITHVPGEGQDGTSDVAYWRIILEVKKDDVSGINKINCYNQTT